MDNRLRPEECRELLGDAASTLSDEELLALRDDAYDLSSVLVDAYLDFKSKVEDLQLDETTPPDAALRVILGWDQFEDDDDADDIFEDESEGLE